MKNSTESITITNENNINRYIHLINKNITHKERNDLDKGF